MKKCKCGNPTRTPKYHDCPACHNENNKRLKNKRSELLRRYKRKHGCANCGYKDNAYALQFDHIDKSLKTKDKLAQTRWKSMSKAKVKAELSNCRVLCANCHMIHSWDPKGL